MNTAARHLPTDNLAWFKSSYSSNEGGNCLEVATHTSGIHIRDSKNPSEPVLSVSPSTWATFLDRA
ncbi:DUF397 domain-containing protein [Streptomyces sp. SID12488]|uniref:DUF397 domain-containing protein n=1 Tax=Streptomyces sp. SID12488 TaxID=2706040 RepID=UPI0013DC0C84|nr:DUF397 domain-containing protein [Streptomyces sp. SID12488]NEA68829.1 DUF397 domain-containing protein [Streptomyces sp. SID12488]